MLVYAGEDAGAGAATKAAVESADRLATSALQLLLHMSTHVGCQAAMVQELATLRCLCTLVYRPTSYRCLEGALNLLRAVSGECLGAFCP